MIIGLFPNEQKAGARGLSHEIASFLESKNVRVLINPEVTEKVDFVISMGGDGTMLRLAHQFPDAVMVGINLGHLGFMADIPAHDVMASLEDLLEGKYEIEERLTLQAGDLHAVNDLVIHRGSNHSLVELAIHVDGSYVNTFVADGLVIATPNGSTAYSLAAGGPILTPNLDALVITPISPHTISNRPLVLSSYAKIQVEYLSSYAPVEVRADGLSSATLSTNESLIVQRSERTFKLARLHRHDYFATLRTKLAWSGKLR